MRKQSIIWTLLAMIVISGFAPATNKFIPINDKLNIAQVSDLNTLHKGVEEEPIDYYPPLMLSQIVTIIIILVAIFGIYMLFTFNKMKENRALNEALNNRITQATTLSNMIVWSFKDDTNFIILNDSVIALLDIDEEDILYNENDKCIRMDIVISKYIQTENFAIDFNIAKYNLEKGLVASQKGVIEWRKQGTDNEVKYISYIASTDHNSYFNSFFMITRDITKEHLYELNLERQIITDTLTGAKNRTAIFNLSPEYLTGKTLVYFDIDNFSVINDNYSHTEGDFILKTVVKRAKLIQNALDVYRMGGDEILIILSDFNPLHANKIINSVLDTIVNRNLLFDINGSFGFYTVEANESVEEAVNIVDYAMSRAKKEEKNSYVIVDKKIVNDFIIRGKVEGELKGAIDRGEIIPYFQPYIAMDTKEIVGFETLVRWAKDGQIISPFYFLEAAHKTGLIVDIDMLMFEKSLEMYKELNEKFDLKPYFNFSSNFTNTSLARINPNESFEYAARVGVAAEKMSIEITEQLLVDKIALDKINRIQELGFKISLDDFSAGYSSLNRLKELNIDVLKLDRLLLVDAGENETSYEIYRTIVNLGKFLKAKIVSEGVETFEQEKILLDNEVHIGQGYLYSKPVDKEGFFELMREDIKRRKLM
ncbi:MAG: EAL domain-containing protein [Lachnospirales bacterium]